MAQNEMTAKPVLPERVRSMEGLGVWLYMLLQNLPSAWIVPAATQPEPIANLVFRVNEYVAAGDLCLCKLGEAVVDQTLTNASISLSLRDGQVIERPGSTVVATQYGANNDTPDFCNGAEVRVSFQERFDGFVRVRFIEPQAFDL